MRAIAAMLFSGLLLWMQAGAGLSPLDLPYGASCCGCQCADRSCCESPVPARSHSLPIFAQRTTDKAQVRLAAPAVTAYQFRPASFGRTASLPPARPRPSALPLYQQYRALLI